MDPLFSNEKPVTIDASTSLVETENSALKTTSAPAGIEVVTEDQIDKLGDTNSSQLATISHKMLSSVRASDADVFGEKLNELIIVAKGLDPSKFNRKGLIAKFSSLFGTAKEKVLAQYQTVDARMKTLITELDRSGTLQEARIKDLEDMYAANLAAHNGIEAAAAEGDRLIQVLRDQLAVETAATDAFSAQRKVDISNRIDRLEKRIDDLRRAMLLAKQAAPEIRLLQDNARTLSSKFKDVKAVTIPAWQNAFSLFLIQLEQKKGAELITKVHDATDEAFRLQADLLRQNTGDIARAKQRSVVSIETLEHVQQQLLGSFDDMSKIAEEGRRSRKEAEPKLKALEQELINRFAPKS